MSAQPYSAAKKAANKKWDAAHKERTRYISDRSKARSFVKNRATTDDLHALLALITEQLEK
ncbi:MULTISPECIES: hypothetical protein [Lactobacillaceae]|uniref:hypothetical protein n=1 Tax=Lactobacillaceae TaxID=33958 RepID=UPI00145710FB|nr:hypothetical protein [Lactobacillus sp. HBUAS51381]NLR09911.1 hypothetical protein [Lactobacillus sp. HBUAS51381]